MRRLNAALAACVLGLGSFSAAADSQPNVQDKVDEARELALQAAGKIIEALKEILGRVPHYETPEVLPNGDILIRRKKPKPEPDRDPGETRT
jgi:hypothetical protein